MRERDANVAKREQKGVVCSLNLALAPDGPTSSPLGCREESVPREELKPSLGGAVGRENASSGLCFNISK